MLAGIEMIVQLRAGPFRCYHADGFALKHARRGPLLAGPHTEV